MEGLLEAFCPSFCQKSLLRSVEIQPGIVERFPNSFMELNLEFYLYDFAQGEMFIGLLEEVLFIDYLLCVNLALKTHKRNSR